MLSGETDLIVTHSLPARRAAIESTLIGHRDFALVAAATNAPEFPAADLAELWSWVSGAAWVTYSHELPITRTFWSTAPGRPFDADIRMTAPDLRVVATAVEHGLGISLLPHYICQHALVENRLVSLYDVTGLIPADPWFATIRRSDSAHPVLTSALASLRE